MTTIAIADTCCERPASGLTIRMPDGLRSWLDRRREQRVLARMARLSPHLIRDAGLDPDDVYDAVPGRWEEAHPGHLRIR